MSSTFTFSVNEGAEWGCPFYQKSIEPHSKVKHKEPCLWCEHIRLQKRVWELERKLDNALQELAISRSGTMTITTDATDTVEYVPKGWYYVQR